MFVLLGGLSRVQKRKLFCLPSMAFKASVNAASKASSVLFSLRRASGLCLWCKMKGPTVEQGQDLIWESGTIFRHMTTSVHSDSVSIRNFFSLQFVMKQDSGPRFKGKTKTNFNKSDL